MTRVVEYTIIFGIMFLIFGVATVVIDEAVTKSQSTAVEQQYQVLADRVADAVEETVTLAVAYPNLTYERRLTLPSALRSQSLDGQAQNYIIHLSNDRITISSSEGTVAVSRFKTIPSDFNVTGGVSPAEALVVQSYLENGFRQIRLALGDDRVPE